MKRLTKLVGLLLSVVVLNLLTVAVFLSALPVTVTVAGTNGEPCVLGDVNGNGSASVADALYLLNWLFADGEEPVACASGPASTCCWPPRPEDIVNIKQAFSLILLVAIIVFGSFLVGCSDVEAHRVPAGITTISLARAQSVATMRAPRTTIPASVSLTI